MNYGVVAEFNPFHNGHRLFIESLKADGCSTVTAVMSESFVQRGECALLSVNSRVKSALMSGVDLVLSLPLPYAVSSAERFAYGGVYILDALNALDRVAFGSECGDIDALSECAKAVCDDSVTDRMSLYLKKGESFPRARQNAVNDVFGRAVSEILSNPNDLLAVEYIKALTKLNSKLLPIAVRRTGAFHDSPGGDENIRSASEIRSLIFNGGDYKSFLPDESCAVLDDEMKRRKAPADFKQLETAVLSSLRKMTADDFKRLPDVTGGLENRLYDAVRVSGSIDELIMSVKSKCCTHARIRRILLSAYLGLQSGDALLPPPYIRVLGFNENGARLLKNAENAKLPIVTKLSEIKKLGGEAERIFNLECSARDLFSLSLPKPDICGREMTDKIIIM